MPAGRTSVLAWCRRPAAVFESLKALSTVALPSPRRPAASSRLICSLPLLAPWKRVRSSRKTLIAGPLSVLHASLFSTEYDRLTYCPSSSLRPLRDLEFYYGPSPPHQPAAMAAACARCSSSIIWGNASGLDGDALDRRRRLTVVPFEPLRAGR